MKILFFLLFPLLAWAQLRPEIVVTTGHSQTINAIAFHPQGDWIASGSSDRTVRIWSKSLRREYRVLYGHRDEIHRIAYSSDGKYLFSGDRQGHLFTWNPLTGELLDRNRLDLSYTRFVQIPKTDAIAFYLSDSLFVKPLGKPKQLVYKGTHSDELVASPKTGLYLGFMNFFDQAFWLVDWKNAPGQPAIRLPYQGFVTKLRLHPDDSYLAGLDITQRKVILLDTKQPGKLRTLALADSIFMQVHDLEFSPDGKQLALVQNNALTNRITVHYYNLDNLKLERSQVLMGIGAYDIEFSPSGDMLGLGLTRVQTHSSKKIDFSIEIALLNPKTGKQLGSLGGFVQHITHLSADTLEQQLCAFHTIDKYMGLRTWNLREGDLERYTESYNLAASSSNGQLMAVWEPCSRPDTLCLSLYRLPDYQSLLSIPVAALRNIAVSDDGRYLAFETLKVDLKDYRNNRFWIEIWDVQQKRKLREIAQPMQRISTMTVGFFRMDPKGQSLLVQSQDSLYSYALATGELQSRIYTRFMRSEQQYHTAVLDFGTQANTVIIGSSMLRQVGRELEPELHFEEWDYTNGKLVADHATGVSGFFQSGDFHHSGDFLVTGHSDVWGKEGFPIMVWDWAQKRVVCRLEGNAGAVQKVWYGHKGERVYSVSEDGFIRIWNIRECKLLASMLALDQADYLLISPDNYYKSSKNNHDAICFRYEQDLYGFDQFDLYFNRPDKVLANLGMSKYALQLYTKAWEKRIARLGYTREQLERFDLYREAPRVAILNREDLPPGTEQTQIKLKIAAQDSLQKLDRILVSVNDVPLSGAQGTSVKGLQQYSGEVAVDLAMGDNIIKVSVFNEKGMESFRESVGITRSNEGKQKSNLYVLAIGVSQFADSTHNLRFAEKDARELIAALDASNQFNELIPRILVNKNVTRETILEQIAFLRKARVDDAIVIFISTHGLLDEQLDYYLATHDTDFKQPALRGLSYQEIERKLLDGLPCRHRLVLLDACHSGELDKAEVLAQREQRTSEGTVQYGIVGAKGGSDYVRPKTGVKDAFTYMQQLFSDVSHHTGATVIAAAGGYEFAIESEKWNGGHGVFTYSILEAFRDKNADQDGDLSVSVLELKEFVVRKVVQLTEGKQRPTTRQENGLDDFILYR